MTKNTAAFANVNLVSNVKVSVNSPAVRNVSHLILQVVKLLRNDVLASTHAMLMLAALTLGSIITVRPNRIGNKNEILTPSCPFKQH